MFTTEPGRLAYTPKEAGQLLGISAKTVQRMAERGEIPFKEIRAGGKGKRVHILIPAAALQKWLARTVQAVMPNFYSTLATR